MAKKRFRDIEIWDKEWYMELAPRLKCLVDYLYDNCDASGVWTPNWKLLNLRINDEKKLTIDDIKLIPEGNFEVLENGKIFVIEFINFQYGTLSEASPAHKPVFQAIKNNNLSNRVFNRLSNSLKEKEKDKEKEMDKEMEKETAKNSAIFEKNKHHLEPNGVKPGDPFFFLGNEVVVMAVSDYYMQRSPLIVEGELMNRGLSSRKDEVMKRFDKKYCFSNFRDIWHMTNAFKMILDNINEKPKLNGSHSSPKLTNWDAAAK